MIRTIRTLGPLVACALLAAACTDLSTAPSSAAVVTAKAVTVASGTSGGSGSGGGGGGVKVDDIKVSKCYTNATATSGGQMLIKAASSDVSATLTAYRGDNGALIGSVQNGGGSRYGGTVMPYQPSDPGTVKIRSSSGGSITVPTTPFQI